jgi:hypothetical protein
MLAAIAICEQYSLLDDKNHRWKSHAFISLNKCKQLKLAGLLLLRTVNSILCLMKNTTGENLMLPYHRLATTPSLLCSVRDNF